MNAARRTPGGLRILVLYDSAQAEQTKAALARVQSAEWPGGRKPELHDVHETRKEADWFGIVEFPAVAIVEDGMLVAIEHECTQQACERVMAQARARGPQLRRRGV